MDAAFFTLFYSAVAPTNTATLESCATSESQNPSQHINRTGHWRSTGDPIVSHTAWQLASGVIVMMLIDWEKNRLKYNCILQSCANT
jgi:hypothetical protein